MTVYIKCVCGNWQLALRGSPADLRFSSTGSSHLNEDHYGRAEGHCIVVSQSPVKSKNTASGRDFYAEIKMESLGCQTRQHVEHHGTSIRGEAMQFRAAHLADFSRLGFCLVNYLPRIRSWLVPDCYNHMTW